MTLSRRQCVNPTPTTHFDRVLVASPKYPYVGCCQLALSGPLAYQGVAHASGWQDSQARTLALRYCTVTSVPTGISEKNLRAVSAGNRMQPWDAG